jgi:hypothetical protein
MDTEEGNKTEEEKVRSVEDQSKRGKVRQRRQAVLLGEVSLPEEGDRGSDRAQGYAVNRPNEVAKRSGTPKRVIVHRSVIEVA